MWWWWCLDTSHVLCYVLCLCGEGGVVVSILALACCTQLHSLSPSFNLATILSYLLLCVFRH